jgi:hypothetical protein
MRGQTVLLLPLVLLGCDQWTISIGDGQRTPTVDAIADGRPTPVDTRGCAACGAPKICCSGACIDPLSDNDNCGACGVKCLRVDHCADCSEICRDGVCRNEMWPKIVCGAVWIDPMSDPNNCGACGIKCDPTKGFACVAGKCSCVGDLSACGTPPRCVSLLTDPDNCGACGTLCWPSICAVCESGACKVDGCPAPMTVCNCLCVDLSAAPQNCGQCGMKCDTAGGKMCIAGQCACPKGKTECNGTCVDTNVDPLNCGGCGCKCASWNICMVWDTAPRCVSDCPTGQTPCPRGPPTCSAGTTDYDLCVNLSTDNSNCGACGVVCPLGTSCVNGSCAP